MFRLTRKSVWLGLAALLVLWVSPAEGAKKKFSDSDDAKEANEPQKFLKNYDKLEKGKDADWVYMPQGSLKKFKKVTVNDFQENGRGREAREAAREGKEYMEQWLEKEGFEVVEKGGEITVEGNVFNAWEPGTGARIWGGWMANPGVGLEVMVKDGGGNLLAEIRQKSRGSTIHDAVENALEDVAKAMAEGR
jgi:hypothetical protein